MTSQPLDSYKTGFDAGFRAGLAVVAKVPGSQKVCVLEFVRANHGLRSAEIAALMSINHCSVRTALHRLSDAGLVHSDNGRWSPANEQRYAR